MSTKELLRITEGSNIWTFTPSNELELYQSPSATGVEIYTPRICGVGEINDTIQVGKNTLDVSFPLLDDLAQHFLQSPVDFVARLDLYSKDEAGDFRTEWRGKLTKVDPDDTKIKLKFNSVFSSNNRVGARPVYQRPCRHTLYGPGCTVDYETFKTAATVTAIASDGITLTIPEAASITDGVLNGGVIEMPDGTKRYISSHSGSTVKIIRVSPSLLEEFLASNPVNVFIAPGCRQTTQWCKDIFDNLLNHGGFPFMPTKNPQGSAIQ